MNIINTTMNLIIDGKVGHCARLLFLSINLDHNYIKKVNLNLVRRCIQEEPPSFYPDVFSVLASHILQEDLNITTITVGNSLLCYFHLLYT